MAARSRFAGVRTSHRHGQIRGGQTTGRSSGNGRSLGLEHGRQDGRATPSVPTELRARRVPVRIERNRSPPSSTVDPTARQLVRLPHDGTLAGCRHTDRGPGRRKTIAAHAGMTGKSSGRSVVRVASDTPREVALVRRRRRGNESAGRTGACGSAKQVSTSWQDAAAAVLTDLVPSC